MAADDELARVTLQAADRTVETLRGLVAAHRQMGSALSRELAANLRTIAAGLEGFEDQRRTLLGSLETELAKAEAATAALWARYRSAPPRA